MEEGVAIFTYLFILFIYIFICILVTVIYDIFIHFDVGTWCIYR